MTFHLSSFLDWGVRGKKSLFLKVIVVLNNKEAPMHDTTSTCSCDCGVRARCPVYQLSHTNRDILKTTVQIWLIASGRFLSQRECVDKTRQQLNGKQGHTNRIQQLQKKCLSLWEVNSSQRDTALCSTVLAQSGTDAMVPLIPWPVPGHQRLDAYQSPLGAMQHAKTTLKTTLHRYIYIYIYIHIYMYSQYLKKKLPTFFAKS